MRIRPLLLALALAPVAAELGAADARAQDITGQCIASSEQGLDLRKQEKLLDARKVLATCATTKCPDEIRTTCEQRITEINRVLPAVVFDVKDAAGNDQSNVKVSIDGVVVATQLGGRSTPVDPGSHVFTIEIAGQPPVQRTLVINEGEKDRHEKVVIGAPAEIPPASAVAPVEASTTTTTAATSTSTSTGSGQKTLGLVAGGVGVVGLAVGSVFGLVASSKWSSAKSDCGASCPSNATARQEASDASSSATLSTVGFVAGGALLAGGLILYFTAPSGPKSTASRALTVTPSVGPGEAAFSLRGKF